MILLASEVPLSKFPNKVYHVKIDSPYMSYHIKSLKTWLSKTRIEIITMNRM